MSRQFQCKAIPSSWLEHNGRRLDCGPYMSGALEARELLKKHKTESLVKITNGIYHAGREARQYVDDPEYGVPFLGSSDILLSDLSHVSYLSKKQVARNLNFTIHEGWSLITRSGTIGRTAYVRKDMDNFSCSEDVLRVVPDTNIIKSGYLYAYLSSRFGVPLIASGTYGAIVQHIEPEHITNLPVPRLGNIEDRAHELIQKAADLQVESTKSFNSAGQIINNQFGFPEKLSLSHRVFSCVEVSSTQILKRLDATYYDNAALESDRLIENVMSKNKFSSLNVSISENGRIKQVFVDEEFGVPFLTSREIFFQQYKPDRFLATNLLPDDDNWTVQEENILLARSGQVGGIIGRGVWADKRFTGCAVSVDVLRIDARYSEILPGYLYAYLCRTDVGYRQLIRTAAGSSIPHLSADDVYNLFIPRCDLKTEEKIDKIIRKAGQQRVEAQAFENEARALVERAIEEGGR